MAGALKFEVRRAGPDERPLLENLLQLYMYDFSEFAGGTVRRDGRFPYHDDFGERWGRPWFHPFVLEVLDEDPRDRVSEWRPAGFALVANASNFGGPVGTDQWLMDDFFVMRKYRRSGVGTMLARYCFERFRGRWEVAEMPQNTAAQSFWRRVVGEYTGGRFQDLNLDNEHWRGPIQTFDNSVSFG